MTEGNNSKHFNTIYKMIFLFRSENTATNKKNTLQGFFLGYNNTQVPTLFSWILWNSIIINLEKNAVTIHTFHSYKY